MPICSIYCPARFANGGTGRNARRRVERSEIHGLRALSDAGLDGVLVVFPRYETGLREFRDVTYPLMKQAELRDVV
jgi:hypothetical protein